MESIESLLYQYLEKYGFISWHGGLRTFNKEMDYFEDYLKPFFESYLKTKGINIISYSWDYVERYGNYGIDDAERITFAWFDGKKIEMCAFITEG